MKYFHRIRFAVYLLLQAILGRHSKPDIFGLRIFFSMACGSPGVELIGRNLKDVPCPSVILDRATVEKNCQRMVSLCNSLGILTRPDFQWHKV